eukprot:13175493-Alexandrium_andersonii.AAC.1
MQSQLHQSPCPLTRGSRFARWKSARSPPLTCKERQCGSAQGLAEVKEAAGRPRGADSSR